MPPARSAAYAPPKAPSPHATSSTPRAPGGGEVAALAGVELPILPRRGFILVTEPLPPVVRHKVYAADYVANVASDNAGLETSAVIEGHEVRHGAHRCEP